MATMYVVYQPNMSGPDALQSGETISRHRTVKAMVASERRAQRRIRRQPGGQNSWHDYHYAAEDDGPSGDRRELTDAEHEQARRAKDAL